MGILSNGRTEIKEQREEQLRQSQHQSNLANSQQAFADDGSMREAYIDKMTDSSLDQGTVTFLSNFLSQDFVLANYTDAEHHEVRWLARELLIEIEAMHPNDDCLLTGEFRKFFFDNDRQALEPLDDGQRATLFQFVQGVIARASRAKGGFQQEQFSTQISVSEVRERDEEDDGGWLS